MKRVLSGLKPTGDKPHIGNYFGAIKQFVDMQDQHENFIFVANYHALTSVFDADDMRERTLEMARTYLALGLDPEKTVLFIQSDVPEVTELAWILNCLTPMGLLSRAHAYKDAEAKNKAVNVGLFDYPVLQAADILIYNSDIVPVGQDQKQHIEMTRDIAAKFNDAFGDFFKLPEPFIKEEVAVVTGTDGQKMSKSYGNTICFFDSEKEIKKSVMSIVTDSLGVDEPKDPDQCNVYNILKHFLDKSENKDIRQRYTAGGLGYGEVKKILLEKILTYFAPMREKYEELKKDDEKVFEILKRGGERARAVASEMMSKIRVKTGLK